MSTIRRADVIGLLVFSALVMSTEVSWGQSKPEVGADQQEQGKGRELDPKGRSKNRLINVSPRYYIWFDREGWHFRTAAKKSPIRKFHGTIRVLNGTFHRLRPIGLEARGKYPDAWTVDEGRTQIDFTIHTAGSFDGYDFTVLGGSDARLEFELYRGGRKFPREIFIGADDQHPRGHKFGFPANGSSNGATTQSSLNSPPAQ